MAAKWAYVDVDRKGVKDAAAWLRDEFRAPDYVTMLSDTDSAELRDRAIKLGNLFAKQATRKRSQEAFQIRLPRDLAEWFGYFCCRPGSGLMPFRAGWQVSRACMRASRARTGPPRLGGKPLVDRALNVVNREERHRKRLQVRIKENQRFDEMLRRNGGSVLGRV